MSEWNLEDSITKFHTLLGTKYVYRIPLRYLVDLGLVSFPIKFHTKFIFNLEKNYTKLFQNRKKVQNLPTTQPDAKIIFHNKPYIFYEQVKLSNHAELAATFVGSIKLENANNNCSISNDIKFDLTMKMINICCIGSLLRGIVKVVASLA